MFEPEATNLLNAGATLSCVVTIDLRERYETLETEQLIQLQAQGMAGRYRGQHYRRARGST